MSQSVEGSDRQQRGADTLDDSYEAGVGLAEHFRNNPANLNLLQCDDGLDISEIERGVAAASLESGPEEVTSSHFTIKDPLTGDKTVYTDSADFCRAMFTYISQRNLATSEVTS